MRLLTWNINGVRTLPQYHPWNSLKCFNDILQHLEADIICFQEMKSGRKLLTKDIAVPKSFDGFFSFPQKKTGYSGVATYTRSETATPLKAEEGLSGLLQPKPPLSAEERISGFGTYPPQLIDEEPTSVGDDEEVDYKVLDGEGRAVVLDFGLFVLVNTYCPNDGTGTEERERFKMDYHKMLEIRVKGLIEKEKREVIVVGDLNACAAVIDHCEGEIMVSKGLAEGLEGEEGFWRKGARRWIRNWLQNEDGAGGPMVDIVRRFWPDRKGMYTCWNTKISARETNYGARIDFILVTPGLVPWIKAGDTLPQIKGSDHCPVYVDFHDEIINSDGTVVRLCDVLGAQVKEGRAKDPPRLSARFWEEFSGKQTSLQQFFGGKPKAQPISTTSQSASLSPTSSSIPTPTTVTTPSELTQVNSPSVAPTPTTSRSTHSSDQLATTTSTKRKFVPESYTASKRPKKEKKGQQSIASFFAKPATASSSSSSSATKSKPSNSSSANMDSDPFDIDTEDEDYKLALQLSQEPDSMSSPASSQSEEKGKAKAQSKQAWTTLLAPIQPPRCRGHGEPAKEYTVNKPGPNKGKKFFICPRPVGPGYDKGRSERLREHVDPQYRCDYFKWSSDVRKEMMKRQSGS